ARTADQPVLAVAAVENVVAGIAFQPVFAAQAEYVIAAIITIEAIADAGAFDGVVFVVAEDEAPAQFVLAAAFFLAEEKFLFAGKVVEVGSWGIGVGRV